MDTTEYQQLFESRPELKGYLVKAIKELFSKYPPDPDADRQQLGQWLDTHFQEAIAIAQHNCYFGFVERIFNDPRVKKKLSEGMCQRVYARLREGANGT